MWEHMGFCLTTNYKDASSLGTTTIKLGFSVAGDDLGLAAHLVREELQDEVNDGLDGTAARRRGF
jgi:hypothetical protein